MLRAYGYVRVSSRAQAADDRDGIPRQQESIRKWARANGVHIAQWFIESVSGTKDLENRPALQELVAALHSNGVKTVLIEKLDRLARDLMIQESIVADFERSKLTLVSVAEPDLCSTDPTRTLLRQMMGAFAQYERTMNVLKLRGARQRMRAKEGRCEGRKPFGTRPGEHEVVQRIVELNKQGKNLNQIAATLTAEKQKSRMGGQWFPQQVSRVLERAGVK
jgi:DNA invertase Pin-like site-specific DNA recombinase